MDESGIHDSSPVLTVAAYVARREQWQDIYRAVGLGSSFETPCEHTGWGYMFQDESMRYCPPYFNLGVLAAPAVQRRRGRLGLHRSRRATGERVRQRRFQHVELERLE